MAQSTLYKWLIVMLRVFLSSYLVLLFALPNALSCSCGFASFCDTYGTPLPENQTWVSAFVEIITSQSDGISIQYTEVSEPTLTGTSVFILNGSGSDCRRSTSHMKVGQRYFIIFPYELHTSLPDTSFFSGCFNNLLRLEGSDVTGFIKEQKTISVSLDKLTKLSGCEQLIIPSALTQLSIVSNPVLTVIQLRRDNLSAIIFPNVEITMYSSSGQLVNRLSWISPTETTLSIPIESLPAGIYFLYCQTVSTNRTFKVVKL